jgi:hypothetical protein
MMLEAKVKEVGCRSNLRAMNVTPHVTQNDSITSTGKRRQSARRLRHVAIVPGDDQCIFGWGKQHGTMRRTKHRGIKRRHRRTKPHPTSKLNGECLLSWVFQQTASLANQCGFHSVEIENKPSLLALVTSRVVAGF